MSYRKYVRELETYNITAEPTEFIPEQKLLTTSEDEHLVIYIVVSSFVVLLIWGIIYIKSKKS